MLAGTIADWLNQEWLLTNGRGGYASSTIVGCPTRRYHGWLVWDRPGIISRWLMWSHAAEHLVVDGRTFLLSNFEFNNAIDPHGYQHLTSFQVFPTGPFPGVEWVYRVGPAEMRKRLWLERARDTVAVQYDVSTKNHSPVRLQVWPLIACREASQLRRKMAGDWFEINTITNAFGLRLRTDREACLALAACPQNQNNPAQFVARPDWWYNFRYRQEAACGLEWGEDLYVPGSFVCEGHQNLTLRLYSEAGSDNPKDAVAACRELSAPPFNVPLDNVDTETLLAASGEQFVVELVDIEGETQPTIVAGYPWLESYGRDTCVALPTLLIDAGRADVAANVLTHMAGLLRDGLLPNHVVDDAAEHEYAAADEPLWFVYAADALLSARIDTATRTALLQNGRGILDAYIRGTRARSATTADPAIRMDPEDALITCGGPNIAGTWMDARFQARWITPRAGKPVEVNALWYHALRAVASRMRHAGASEWSNYDALADRVQASFRAKYWQEKLGYLADVVTDAGPDCALRPNQLLAASLPNSPLDPSHAARMLDAVTEHLLTPYGLRTLAPGHADYHGRYEGGPAEREAAAHQGSVYAWLMGPYVTAYLRVHGDSLQTRAAARRLLLPLTDHLRAAAGLGGISELFDGDPPHEPRGCINQAWSVAEVTRAWNMTSPPSASMPADVAGTENIGVGAMHPRRP